MEINIIPKFLDEAVTPLAQRAGNTLSSIWTLAFGGIDIYAEKTQLKRVHALNQFKDELEQAVSSIPEENIIEPPLHIVGPSLEASKYYFENDELRKMFSNLIAASINIDDIDKVHPSFVEIIKQLSPLDAMNLKLFKEVFTYPIAEYNYVAKGRTSLVSFKTNVFLENQEVLDIDLNAASISNLQRLGLVSISYSKKLQDHDYRNYFENYIYQDSKSRIEEHVLNTDVNSRVFEDIDLVKGTVEITPFGINFTKTCV
ncbi:TPA: DUF4393 domain-containing protein [Bacillus cereus]